MEETLERDISALCSIESLIQLAAVGITADEVVGDTATTWRGTVTLESSLAMTSKTEAVANIPYIF